MGRHPLALSIPLALFGAAQAAAQCPLDAWLASDGLEGNHFGTDVALAGDLALVGAPDRNEGAPSSGSAYVFRLRAGTWVEEQKLLHPQPGLNDQFGLAVAIDGDVAICGVPNDDINGFWSGSAQVFRFDGTSWNHEQALAEPMGGRFGWDVDVEGDVILVGSRSEHSGFSQSGAVHVYRHNGVSWVQEQRLVPSDPAIVAQFGHSVALSGEALVVGAWRDDDSGIFTGSAYVFRHGPSGWLQEQKLNASDQNEFYRFGASVGIDGDLIACGAYEAKVGTLSSGAAYVFRHAGGAWTQEAKLSASDLDDADNYGWAVAITGELVAIGSRRDATPLVDSGSIYLYGQNNGAWEELVKFPSAAGSGGQLGQSIAADGDRVLAGGWLQNSPTQLEAGHALLFSSGERCGAGQIFCGCNTGAPCGNLGDAQSGCANQGGLGARLRAQGSASVAAADLSLAGSGLPSGMGLFFQGTSEVNSGAGSPFGDGLLCVSGSIVRLEVVSISNGTARTPSFGAPPIATMGSVAIGDTRFYQLWYRDLGGPCSSGFNLTNAVLVHWEG
jgi:hypothetical protein